MPSCIAQGGCNRTGSGSSAHSFDGASPSRVAALPSPGSELALVPTTAQLALRLRKDGMSRTFSSTGLRTGAARPYGSRRCGAVGRACSAIGFAVRASRWRAVGRSDGGTAYCCGGTLCSIRSAMRRLSLLSRRRGPSASFPPAAARARSRDYRCRSPPPRRGRHLRGWHRRWRRR